MRKIVLEWGNWIETGEDRLTNELCLRSLSSPSRCSLAVPLGVHSGRQFFVAHKMVFDVIRRQKKRKIFNSICYSIKRYRNVQCVCVCVLFAWKPMPWAQVFGLNKLLKASADDRKHAQAYRIEAFLLLYPPSPARSSFFDCIDVWIAFRWSHGKRKWQVNKDSKREWEWGLSRQISTL